MIGTSIGSYEILAELGRGGMGEVYRATDTKLGRAVAVKVLPESFARDAERLMRFTREAKTLASLNHPNIAQIYGIEEAGGSQALVMELVDGEDLSAIIARGAVPLADSLSIAKQIAAALEAAHEQAIVHRDLKPANVKLRADGTVKVLDFGLAKAMNPPSASSASGSALANSPTITSPAMTEVGVILGTAAYMSPEQAKGRVVDRRADIWAFGCVLFEMLTGTRAFPGDDITDTIAAVVRAEPDWSLIPAGLSPTLLLFLKRCLQKDTKQRIGDIHDVRLALDGAFEMAAAPAPSLVVVRPSLWRQALPWALIAFGAGAGAATFVIRQSASSPAPAEVQRFVETMPVGRSLPSSSGSLLVVSADGRTLVYRAVEDGTARLYRRSLNDVTATPIRGSENAGNEAPFLSPDGAWVGFGSRGALMKVPIAGGRPIQIAELPIGMRGAHWGADGSIVLALRDQGLARVSADGGDLTPLSKPSDGRQDWYPQALPGRRAVLFTSRLGLPNNGDVLVLDEASSVRRVVVKDAVGGRYLPSGHVVFVRAGDLWATRFDLDRLEPVGAPVRVEEGVRVEGGGAPQAFVSDSGTLAYIAGGTVSDGRTLWWVDRHGRETPVGAPPGRYENLRLSPDGTRVALDVKDGEGDIWILDLASGAVTRMTFDERRDVAPVWAPDGHRLFFMSTRSGRGQGLYSVSARSAGEPERLPLEDEATQFPTTVTPNGQTLVFNRNTQIMAMELQGPPNVRPIAQTSLDGRMSELSPDGRWLAYESSESGRFEVYVRPYPDVDRAKWQISSGGAAQPLWTKDGRQLLFRAEPDGAVMSVTVNTQRDALTVGRPTEAVAKGSWLFKRLSAPTMAVLKDGRFLMIRQAPDEQIPRIIVATNWFAELERMLPDK